MRRSRPRRSPTAWTPRAPRWPTAAPRPPSIATCARAWPGRPPRRPFERGRSHGARGHPAQHTRGASAAQARAPAADAGRSRRTRSGRAPSRGGPLPPRPAPSTARRDRGVQAPLSLGWQAARGRAGAERRASLRARRRQRAVGADRGTKLRGLARGSAPGARRKRSADPAQGLRRRPLPAVRGARRRRRRGAVDRGGTAAARAGRASRPRAAAGARCARRGPRPRGARGGARHRRRAARHQQPRSARFQRRPRAHLAPGGRGPCRRHARQRVGHRRRRAAALPCRRGRARGANRRGADALTRARGGAARAFAGVGTRHRPRQRLAAVGAGFRWASWLALILAVVRRMFAIPFVAALVGGGVVAAVIAAAGGLGDTHSVTTTVQAAPLQPSNASAVSPRLTPHDIYVRAAPGVAYVTSTIVQRPESPFGLFGGGEQQQQRGQATGSGIVIDSNGTILTNWHVVESAIKVTVSLEKGKTVETQVVGTDPSNDLAVLRIHPD